MLQPPPILRVKDKLTLIITVLVLFLAALTQELIVKAVIRRVFLKALRGNAVNATSKVGAPQQQQNPVTIFLPMKVVILVIKTMIGSQPVLVTPK